MAAQHLELNVDSVKYEARISMLEGYVQTMEGLVTEYETLKNNVTNFMGEDDAQVEQMKENVQVRINRVRKAIEATQANIDTLQDTLSNMNTLGENISTLVQEGLNQATMGLFD